MAFLSYLLLGFSLLRCTSAAIFDLSELSWTLKNENGSIVVPGSVPSQAHLDLLKAGVITEPLLEINDFTQRWVWMDNWTYTADLGPFFKTVSKNSSDQTLLVFYGLDTIANITFADVPVAWVNNQFRQYVFDLTPHIPATAASGGNLTIDFESAFWYGLNVSSRPDAEFFPGGNGVFEVPAARHYIRKQQIDFGWDWAPAFVPTGIHKPAYLITLSNEANSESSSLPSTPPFSPSGSTNTTDLVFIEEFAVDIYKLGSSFTVPPVQSADWVVNVSLALRAGAAVKSPKLQLSLPELKFSSSSFSLPSLDGHANETVWVNVQWHVPDSVPQRWYPHNLGTPQLYNLSVTLDLPTSSSQSHQLSFTTRTGFRTIRLVQLPVPHSDVIQRGITPGDQYHFEINGKEFWSKGSNLVPFDPFYSRITTEQVQWVLQSAVMSNQNIVRVWGGGIYQPSSALTAGGVYSFYDLCDELGILAWSEFLFSDALSPINPFLLESVEPEIRENVRRLNRHPSVAQWAGGNEIEGIVISTNQSLPNGTIYLDQFVTMFQDFLHDIETSESRSVAYTDCSTTNGFLSIDPYILRFNNKTAGDIYGNGERFDYSANDAFDYNTYPVARFVNEFGFHSMPSIYTWEEALLSPADFAFNSTVVVSREHHNPAGSLAFPNPNAPEGQAEMTLAAIQWLPAPPIIGFNSSITSGSAQDNATFAAWCYTTQVFQALTISSEIAFYRRGAGLPNNNLGGIVWQLNDIWQAPSWSSVEFDGRWKVLAYAEERAYRSVIVHPFWIPEEENLEVSVMSDVLGGDVSGTAQMTWYDWSGDVVKAIPPIHFTVHSLNFTAVFNETGLGKILPAGKGISDVWMLVNVTANVPGAGTVINENYFTPTSLGNVTLVDPKISLTTGDELTFTLEAKGGVAPWTWLEHPAGTVGAFVDSSTGSPTNGFFLIPGIPKTVKFVLNSAVSPVQNPSPSDFVVRSLFDNIVLRSNSSSGTGSVETKVLLEDEEKDAADDTPIPFHGGRKGPIQVPVLPPRPAQ
ncbi:glycoside hydrolase family 2 protein [Collybiopsis luxurians FD-317 M1]|uniref:Beta-mannosidase A n=1 Tax=Collybiopsis luxurians FD-317 M1 TaxID=944289 RepID=A0A0D0CHG9_9AGAR|nr:glycoside hydrolase family 2 protein [Collybiopsis luxurians FD-317 M1]